MSARGASYRSARSGTSVGAWSADASRSADEGSGGKGIRCSSGGHSAVRGRVLRLKSGAQSFRQRSNIQLQYGDGPYGIHMHDAHDYEQGGMKMRSIASK